MIKVNVQVDTSKLLLRLEKGQKRLAYAVANALNATAKDIQAAERDRVRNEFEVRTDFIVRQAAIIRPFASARQGRPYVEISVGKKPRLHLGTFEAGGNRPPAVGQRVAVPLTGEAARPSFGQSVLPEFRISKLFGRGKGSRRSKQGKEHTYIVPGVGVFQRHEETTQLIYVFERKVTLRPRLRFFSTAARVASARFRTHLQNETSAAVVRSGGRGL